MTTAWKANNNINIININIMKIISSVCKEKKMKRNNSQWQWSDKPYYKY